MAIDRSKIDEGALHRRLGIPEGQPIPLAELHADLTNAQQAHNIREIRQDVFALNSRGWEHPKGRRKS
jgi:hypothetical protein